MEETLTWADHVLQTIDDRLLKIVFLAILWGQKIRPIK